jgi:hypothetical protein
MIEKARAWRVVVGGVAAAVAGVIGFASASASADPVMPQPVPAPAPVTQTGAVAPFSGVGLTTMSTLAATPENALQQGMAPVPPAAAVTAVPATSGTLTDFLTGKGVTLEPQNPDFKALNITLPTPTGWSLVPDPNVPNAFLVIADRSEGDPMYTSNAQVTVSKLVGDFDPREAITHGYIDSQQLSNWQSTDASLADFSGFPSSIIEGTYTFNQETLNTSRRHIIATAGRDQYLVSLMVTTSVSQAIAAAPATDMIVNGFKVAAATP